MTSGQFQRAIKCLGITAAEAAALFGATDRTARRWAKHGPPLTEAIMLRLLVAGRITFADVEYLVNVELALPRKSS